MSKIDLEKVRAAFRGTITESSATKALAALPITLVSETGSTNDDLKSFARKGSSPRVLIAEKQTAGRGRQGRNFFSEGGVYFSVILPPAGEAVPFLTHIAAVAVCESIRALSGKNALIKWVNDVYIAGKKVCGILCESVASENGRTYIAGIGVNLIEPEGGFPRDIKETATAIELDGNALVGETLKRLFHYIGDFNKERLRREYGELCFLIGMKVFVARNEKIEEATAIALSEDLGLIVRYADGKEEELRSGEVHLSLRREDGANRPQ